MSLEDPYLIPSVPQFKRNLAEDLDDTIGDEFFDKLFLSENCKTIQSPRVPAPAKPVLAKRTSTAPTDSKEPTRRAVRRSLMKPGMPSVGPTAKQEVAKPEVPSVPEAVSAPVKTAFVSNLSPPKAPVTRSRSAHIVEKTAPASPNVPQKSAIPLSSHPQNAQSVYNSKVAAPPAKVTQRRSLLKPGRPSVGSVSNNDVENKPKKETSVQPSNLVAQRKSPARVPLTRLQAAQAALKTTSAIPSNPFQRKILPVGAAVPPPIPSPKSAAKNRRRSFMDPTIASQSKLLGTPMKK